GVPAELRGEARTLSAAINVLFALHAEDRQHALEDLAVAARHESQLALLRAVLASGDGRIQHFGPLTRQVAGEPAAGGGTDGARIDEHCTLANAAENTRTAQHHFFHRRRITHDAPNYFRLARRLRRTHGNARTRIGERLGLLRGAVEDRQVVSGFNQIQRHRLAHDSKAKESDLRCYGASQSQFWV